LRGARELAYVSPNTCKTLPNQQVGQGTPEDVMAFIPALNTLRVTLEYTLNGQLVVNVFYLKKSTPIATIDITNAVASIKSWFTTYLKPHLGNSLSLVRVVARDMTVENGAVVESAVVPAIVGSLAEEPLSNNVALVVSFKTGLVGRSLRGRVYMPGLTENQLTGNDVTTGAATGLVTGWSNLNSFVGAQGFALQVASFRNNGAPRVSALLTPVTNYNVTTRVDTQRRRLPK